MKPLLILILSLSFSLAAFAQDSSQDSCFTDRREAKNQTINGLKEGKWVVYEHLIPGPGEPLDTGAAYYILTVYRNGKPVGIEREYYMKSGKLRRKTTYFKNGGSDSRSYLENGNEVISNWQENKADSGFTNKAEAKNIMVNGKKEGKWFERKYDLEGETTDINAPYYMLIIYKEGNPYGIRRVYYKNGKLECVTHFTNGKKNGIEKEYYQNGRLMNEIPWINDTIDGIEKEYYESGRLYIESQYINGKLNGIKKVYYADGALEKEEPYMNGKENGVEKDYDMRSGKLLFEIPYSSGKKDGVEKDYDENEILQAETLYSNGNEVGVVKEYYKSGKLKSETNYTNGLRGLTKNYDENGNEIKK